MLRLRGWQPLQKPRLETLGRALHAGGFDVGKDGEALVIQLCASRGWLMPSALPSLHQAGVSGRRCGCVRVPLPQPRSAMLKE